MPPSKATPNKLLLRVLMWGKELFGFIIKGVFDDLLASSPKAVELELKRGSRPGCVAWLGQGL